MVEKRSRSGFGKQNLCVTWLKQEVAINHILLNVNGREQTCKCCVRMAQGQ